MKRRSNPITPDRRDRIKGLLASGQLYQHQIAAIEGVNQGRISEVKDGKYD